MPQNGAAAEAGTTRPNTVTATAARTSRRRDVEWDRGLFMAGLQWCAPPRESRDTPGYYQMSAATTTTEPTACRMSGPVVVGGGQRGGHRDGRRSVGREQDRGQQS